MSTRGKSAAMFVPSHEDVVGGPIGEPSEVLCASVRVDPSADVTAPSKFGSPSTDAPVASRMPPASSPVDAPVGPPSRRSIAPAEWPPWELPHAHRAPAQRAACQVGRIADNLRTRMAYRCTGVCIGLSNEIPPHKVDAFLDQCRLVEAGGPLQQAREHGRADGLKRDEGRRLEVLAADGRPGGSEEVADDADDAQ